MKQIKIGSAAIQEFPVSTTAPDALAWPAKLSDSSALLLRMFRDPRVLESEERRNLVARLREAVEIEPHVPEIRVLLGMALCVDLQPQEALEQLRQATQQAPGCFIARLKFGELLMRLRICNQALEETQAAAKLALNTMQSEMARKQAATIRTMLREGIERGGYGVMLSHLIPFRRKQSRIKAEILAETR